MIALVQSSWNGQTHFAIEYGERSKLHSRLGHETGRATIKDHHIAKGIDVLARCFEEGLLK